MILEFKNASKKNLIENLYLTLKDGNSIEIISDDPKALDILKLIIGHKKLNSGKIIIFDHDSKDYLNTAKRFIGYARELKIKGNKRIYTYLRQTESFYSASYLAEIDKYLDMFGLDKNKYIKELDENEKYTLAIINSIFYNPSLILLNGITDHLEIDTLNILNKILSDLKKNGSSIISLSSRNNLSNPNHIYSYDSQNLTISEVVYNE